MGNKVRENITILGSTGSIGNSTLSIIRENKTDFNIYALSAKNNWKALLKQCLEFSPKYAVILSKTLSQQLNEKLKEKKCRTKVLYKTEKLSLIASDIYTDTVIVGIVGIDALKPLYAAIKAKKKILLANKEAIVSAGHILIEKIKLHGAKIIPIDSEHNAIFQCLPCNNKYYDEKLINKIIITASGGTFYNIDKQKIKNITVEKACKHPNWQMGKKISIDCSTMMNKALEVVEAYWLFKVPIDKIEVLIHPQSIIHSMVRYHDGSILAQLSMPNIKTQICHALYYPKRKKMTIPQLDFAKHTLSFENINLKQCKPLSIVYEILKEKKYSSNIVLNAANEYLVQAFMEKKIEYKNIIEYLDITVKTINFPNAKTIDEVIEISNYTSQFVNKRFLRN